MPAKGQNALKNDVSQSDQCIPAHQFAELPESIAGTQTDAYGKTAVALGAYERVSPDGRFVLRSFSGQRLGEVSLIELSAQGQVIRAIPTPLRNEAFPVQGSWRYLVDVNGDHYTLESIVQDLPSVTPSSRSTLAELGNRHLQQRDLAAMKPQPVFRGGMDGFYAAAAELSSSKPGHIRIRSLSWPNASGDSQSQGEGALVSRTIEVDVQRQRITQDTGPVFHCRERIAQDGPLYALPMISVDGHEFAALPQTPVQGKQTMRIFGFGESGTACQARETFDFSSGKAIFGFSSTGKAADIAWEYNGQAFWYSRELQTPFNIAPYELEGKRTGQGFELQASAFPGLARDGRVIYGATLKDCTSGTCKERVGYMISDPYQSNAYQNFLLAHKGAARRQCITVGDVQRERQRLRIEIR
ncbi:MAG: hypothetical protein HC765_15090 [Brachymonas sp.]|nr:hypothetical protein [Brachymonas sp.]